MLDFGAQYAQLIARRIREAGVYSEIWPHDVPADALARARPAAIVFSGGPASVYAPGAPQVDPALFDLGIPVLGICYGQQLMARVLGGDVREAVHREYGPADLDVTGGAALFRGLPRRLRCWMSHGDLVLAPPPGFAVLGRTPNSPVAAMGDPKRRLYGVQFHPEVAHTQHGADLLRNFLYGVAGCRGTWTPGNFIDGAVARIRRQVGDGRAVCGLSGGVDSAVAAALVHRAIGDRLTCIFVDHGLLRKGEREQVEAAFRDALGIPLVVVDAADRFLARLEGVDDPEEKRRRIGEEFIRVFEAEAARLVAEARGRAEGPIGFLVQGTIYPDVIESGTRTAATIKTHHNVGGLPEDLEFALVEPLRNLFKDEVRRVGAELGLPDAVVWRQPFPGPGLAVRVLGPVTREKLAIVREADAIVDQEIRAAGLDRILWQSFAVLLPLRSVGVMGDARTYAYPVVLRCVTSQDAMTADWARLDYELLERIASRIVNEVPHVNRVVYDVTSKPPATIEWE